MFDLRSLTPRQREITEDAIRRCTFNFNRLQPGLRNKVGRELIPVEWTDLSRYGQAAEGEGASAHGHFHVHEEGDVGHGIVDRRERVLGLAWYSGRISIEQSLESNPTLAGEVFLSEAAHMVDFFMITEEERKAIFKAFHGGSDAPHGHNWFDNASYWDDVGESFMGGFVAAYSDYPVTLAGFSHKPTQAVAADIRNVFDPAPPPPPPTPEPPPPPPTPEEPPSVPEATYFGTVKGKVYHSRMHGRGNWRTVSPEGRRPCRVCKPTPPA